MNAVEIIGRITKDLELKETESGVKYTRFSIAVNRRFKNEDGEYETDFFNVVAWRGTAEFITNYFGKGKRIGIVGRLQTNKYTDKDGNERINTEIVVNEAYLIENKSDNTNTTEEVETTDNEAENTTRDEINEQAFADFGDSIEISDDEIAF